MLYWFRRKAMCEGFMLRRSRELNPTSGHSGKQKATQEKLMTAGTIVIWLLVGAIAGWLAGALVKGGGFGLVGNIVVGIVGAVLGGWLFPRMGIEIGTGFLSSVITATMGAVVLLFIVRLFRRTRV
ncbi:MAG: GlsB/YeaQ/YmgE family stress response membrane protein [Vitreimonas sp.]